MCFLTHRINPFNENIIFFKEADKEMFIQFGDSGLRIAKLARAEDNRPVKSYKKRKSISSETTFNNDISSLDTLSNILWKVSLATSDRCKSLNLAGYTITLKLKTSNFKTITNHQERKEEAR